MTAMTRRHNYPLTIKSVLDQFAECGLFDGDHYRFRTMDYECALQVATKSIDRYDVIAEAMGLPMKQANTLMRWADDGIWPIRWYGKNPMEAE